MWHATIAVLVIAALAVQVAIAVQATAHPPGHAVGTLAGTALAGRLVRVLSFFTIQSNVLSAITSAQLALRPDRDRPVWRVVRLDAMLGITVTGIVYSTVLARIHEPKGWEQVSTNTAFHYLVPIMMVMGWLLFGPRPRIDATVMRWSLLWPVLWFSYTLVHGEMTRWYPYPFTDVATNGYSRVLVNAFLVTVVLGLVALLFGVGDRRMRRAPDPAATGVGAQDDSARTTPDSLGRPR
ncbi:MAG: hypothetical protein QOG80_1910 [Pseudonocardiales bacterium]|nr:hypothetical protein [Pseudonocardiales bacterium]